MSDELGRDIIEGRIIDWSKMSTEELKKMRESVKEKEKAILNKINKELEQDDEEESL